MIDKLTLISIVWRSDTVPRFVLQVVAVVASCSNSHYSPYRLCTYLLSWQLSFVLFLSLHICHNPSNLQSVVTIILAVARRHLSKIVPNPEFVVLISPLWSSVGQLSAIATDNVLDHNMTELLRAVSSSSAVFSGPDSRLCESGS